MIKNLSSQCILRMIEEEIIAVDKK